MNETRPVRPRSNAQQHNGHFSTLLDASISQRERTGIQISETQMAQFELEEFLEPIHVSDLTKYGALALKAFETHGPIPKVMWGIFITHRYNFSSPSPKVEFRPEEIEKFIELGFKCVGKCNAELSNAIERIVSVYAAHISLENKPTYDVLNQAEGWLDRFKTLRAEPTGEFEDWYGEQVYGEVRGRHRAWQAVLQNGTEDARFQFVAEYIYPSDLEWAVDPLVVLPEFQRWAKEEIVARRVTQPLAEFRGHRPDMSTSYRTRPTSEMPALHVGRLLAALLSGLDTAECARMMMGDGKEDLLEILLDCGLDANAVTNESEPILHAAARQNDAKAISLLLERGADPNTKFERKTARGVAGSKGKKAFDAKAKSASKRKPKQPKRLLSFHDDARFVETTYADISVDHRIAKLSDDDWHAEDLFGDDPKEVLRSPPLVWAGDFVCTPDDYGYLIIDGDLAVEGTLLFETHDFANVIVVLGDLSARELVVTNESHLYVLGDTRIAATACFGLGDAGSCRFFGSFNAGVAVQLGTENVTCELGAPEGYGVDYLKPHLIDDEHVEWGRIVDDLKKRKQIVDPDE